MRQNLIACLLSLLLGSAVWQTASSASPDNGVASPSTSKQLGVPFKFSDWRCACNDPEKKVELFARFLSQYNLIGMKRSKVAQLLGDEGDLRLAHCCSGATYIELNFANDKVTRWRIAEWDSVGGIHDRAQPWVDKNVLLKMKEPMFPLQVVPKVVAHG